MIAMSPWGMVHRILSKNGFGVSKKGFGIMVKKWFWGVQNTYSKSTQKMVAGTMGPGPRPWPKAQFPGPALAPAPWARA